ncbi:DNA polymerase III subunit chi [Rhodoferax antarcticus]|uniref:DNA polymerase III subunit chi n=1 Tax=Rhodoferax antarcticus TaxID=81479 RepID=UPI00222424BE|nr:DNA polymerase III subunit chi [Rhodoferax antarcticus]MCW2313040.1 DNA polymerase-3 subunit chi [Rhodoferax antarcticus]
MTQVAFHFNVEDRLHHSCRLVRKGIAAGTSLVVTGPWDVLDQFDRALWALSATEFLPHCRASDSDSLVQKSSVLLCESLTGIAARDVLVNLGQTAPDGFEVFPRVIEVVSTDEAERGPARLRWKHYAQAGSELVKHDLGARAAP